MPGEAQKEEFTCLVGREEKHAAVNLCQRLAKVPCSSMHLLYFMNLHDIVINFMLRNRLKLKISYTLQEIADFVLLDRATCKLFHLIHKVVISK